MGDAPLDVHYTKLATATVTMATVARQLQAVQDAIDHHCHLPAFALGGIGEIARIRYNEHCSTASRQVGDLVSDATKFADGIASNIAGYVSVEDVNLEAMLHSLGAQSTSGSSPASGAVDQVHMKEVGWLIGEGNTIGVVKTVMQSRIRRLPGVNAPKIGLPEVVNGMTRDVYTLPKFFPAVNEEDLKALTSAIGKLSPITEDTLRMAGRASMTGAAAWMIWTAAALVRSDEPLNKAISTWAGIADATQKMFHEEVPAITKELFSKWKGEASSAADV